VILPIINVRLPIYQDYRLANESLRRFCGIPIIMNMGILRYLAYWLLATIWTSAAALGGTPALLANMCAPTNAEESSAQPPPLTQQSGRQRPRVETSSGGIGKQLIPDFAEVTPTLYRGAQPRKHGFEALAKMGVKIVVDLRGDRKGERKEVTRLGMRYVPMHWQCSFPKDRIFAEFLTLIQNNPGKKIFVHCRVGDDRTGMMIAAYRMAFEGWSAKQAMVEMTKYGFSQVHRRLICPRLSEYEEQFPERFATKPEFKELRSRKVSQLRGASFRPVELLGLPRAGFENWFPVG
jgi:tyrosine-protein phosphatase SIW14